jgi:Protein of unknown function (DUF4232)
MTVVAESPPMSTQAGESQLLFREARRRRRRRWLAAGTVAVIAVGVPVAVHAVSGRSRPPHPPASVGSDRSVPAAAFEACRNGQIAVSNLYGEQGMGSAEITFGFTNRGLATCTLAGYPTVVLLDSRGGAVASATSDPYDPAGAAVVLHVGQEATASVQASDGSISTGQSCVTGSSFMITPPGSTAGVRVSAAAALAVTEVTTWCGQAGATPVKGGPVVLPVVSPPGAHSVGSGSTPTTLGGPGPTSTTLVGRR